ncbi:MAG: DUF3142 domain-containing protein [Pedosphaera sp.]|nr:DUF3142 domain-containing protein [Pedosphaera sp.]
MKNRAVIFSALLIAATAAAVVWWFVFRTSQHVSGPVRHEVYVWQRAWTEPVREAVSQHATNFAAVVPLKAEISWKDKKPQLTRVAVDYPTLAKAQMPVGIALRIGSYAGPFAGAPSTASASSERSPQRAETVLGAPNNAAAQDEAITTFLCDLAASLVAEAQTNHVALSELQIDFDCAESKLDGYRVWVEAIQRRVAPLPVTITALPSWLNARAFKRLVAVATNYVLQVHSVERPRSFDAPFTLCDPRKASRWVETAGRIGVPFRAALPTYGYTLAFDHTGKFIGLSAEGPRPNWPTNAQLREVFADPIEMSALVQQWTASRPAAMRGVIWYRLPTIVDNFNWRWQTLGAIVASRSLQEKLRIEPRRVEAGLVEIKLVNEGELDISSRLAVEVRWSNARLMAGDALRDFELADRSLSAARFQTKTQGSRLPAGDRVTIGWLRFDHDCEVRCELKKL